MAVRNAYTNTSDRRLAVQWTRATDDKGAHVDVKSSSVEPDSNIVSRAADQAGSDDDKSILSANQPTQPFRVCGCLPKRERHEKDKKEGGLALFFPRQVKLVLVTKQEDFPVFFCFVFGNAVINSDKRVRSS